MGPGELTPSELRSGELCSALPARATNAGRAPGATLLQVEDLSKAFGSTQALDNVSLTVLGGQVHGLVGENGSGKSTLVKILAGYHAPGPGGRIVVGDAVVTGGLAGVHSRQLGLRFVHQDLGIVPELSVTENLFVDRFAAERRLGLRWQREHAKAAALLASFGVEVDPRRPIGSLPAAERAMVAIVRAAEGLRTAPGSSERRGVLVLDEATASLPEAARRRLRAVVDEVVGLGHGVLFVSHLPDEVLAWADHVSVLRDGRVVADRPTAGMTEGDLIELIIGRRLQDRSELARQDVGRVGSALAVDNLRGREVMDFSFAVRAGEILGLTGLVGSGYDEVCQVLGGAMPARAGTLELEGRRWPLQAWSSRRAVEEGMGFVPQDRQRQASSPRLTVSENISLSLLGRHRGPLGLLRRRELRDEVTNLLSEYRVVPPDPELPLGSLSGGNQQKVVIAKAMAACPRVLVLLEPTQGVDVGARNDILAKLRDVARQGTPVVCGSTDASQLEEVCDRVLVLQRGKMAAELTGPEVNEDRIVEETYRSPA